MGGGHDALCGTSEDTWILWALPAAKSQYRKSVAFDHKMCGQLRMMAIVCAENLVIFYHGLNVILLNFYEPSTGRCVPTGHRVATDVTESLSNMSRFPEHTKGSVSILYEGNIFCKTCQDICPN